MGAEHVHGVTITFSSGFFASITSVNGQDLSRGAIDVSDAGSTTWKEFEAADLTDPGGVRISGQFVPATTPPITSAAAACTITFPTTSATITGTAFMTDFSWSGDHEGGEGIFTYEATLKWAGAVTFAAAAGSGTGTGS